MEELRGIIPSRWMVQALPPTIVQEIIFDWLDVEVFDSSQIPFTQELRGWRNREVHAYIAETDWTRSMFGKPALHEYQQPSLAYLRYHAPHRHVPVVPFRKV